MREQHKDLPSKRDVERRHQRMKTTAQNHQYKPEEIQAMVRTSQHVGPVARTVMIARLVGGGVRIGHRV